MRMSAYKYAGRKVKVKVSISIDKKVYEEAHNLGLNVSKVSENYLKLLIEAVKNKGVAGPMGFEPMTFSLEEWTGKAEDWVKFREWLTKKQFNSRYTSTVYNYAQQYYECLLKRDLGRIRDLPDSLRPNVLKALSALAKFTGRYEEWQGLIKSYGLLWVGRSKNDVFIDRLTKIENPEEVWLWIKKAKQKCPELSCFLDLIAVTGLRFIESVNSYNLIIQLESEGKLAEYYREESLEHFRFKDIFLRKSKKAFVSFVPSEIISLICQSKPLRSADAIQQKIRGRGLPLRFGDIREANVSFMTRYLKPPEIDFLQGRVTQSVFMANYFNPALIADLKTRAFQGIGEIQKKID